jgi:hypothetical protein
MYLPRWKSEWGELVIVSIASFILYQMNMLMLFCIPLQVLFIRKGDRQLLYSSAIVLAAIGVAGIFRTAPIESDSFRRGLMATELMLPAFFLTGLAAVNLNWKVPVRTFYKIIVVVVGAGLLSIPLIYLLGKSENFNELVTSQINSVMRLFQENPEALAETAAGLPDTEVLSELIIGILLRNFVFIYFLILSGTIWFGRSITARIKRIRSNRLLEFSLPEWMVWPLLVPWALILLDLRVDIGVLKYIAWNAGLIMLFSFGMQGIGIIQSFFNRRAVSRGIRIALVAAMIMMLFWPGANLLIIIGLPGLGVSELWIHYREEKKE